MAVLLKFEWCSTTSKLQMVIFAASLTVWSMPGNHQSCCDEGKILVIEIMLYVTINATLPFVEHWLSA